MSRSERLIAAAVILVGLAIVAGGGLVIHRDATTAARTPPVRPDRNAEIPAGPFGLDRTQEPEGRTGSVTGLVQTRDGRTAAGAGVVAILFADGRPRLAGEARTSDDGVYTIDRLTPGVYSLRASREGVGGAVREAVNVESDQITQADPLVLTAGATVEIVVEDRGPLAKAKLSLYATHKLDDRRSFPEPVQERFSGADGKITLAGLSDGRYTYKIEKAGYAMLNDSFEIRDGQIVAPKDSSGKPVSPWPPPKKLARNK